MKRLCPQCRAEVVGREMVCARCMTPLPSEYHLNNLLRMALAELDRGNFRSALNHLDELVKENPGSVEGWVLKALCHVHYRMPKEAKDALRQAQIQFTVRLCPTCHGSRRCPECNGSGVCVMCRGRRKCHMCQGKGICPNCGGTGCSVCGGAGKCVRCGGTGRCSYCSGSGACADCDGSGACSRCGGEGRAIEIDLARVSPTIRNYLVQYGHYREEARPRRGLDPLEGVDIIGR